MSRNECRLKSFAFEAHVVRGGSAPPQTCIDVQSPTATTVHHEPLRLQTVRMSYARNKHQRVVGLLSKNRMSDGKCRDRGGVDYWNSHSLDET
ncbi:hypothetical protein EVAR_79667_1 [Eumeta japonica]|uniref:Uncharacterized protein n=1 Tax=Eumeta variegata TaxID=151549 RepID=A0A4C1W8W7_EUMVA|nr:hypothetical protein EVAR_79667_1 [Eumeta japonica]